MSRIDHGDCDSFPTNVIVTQPKFIIKTVQIVSRKLVKKNEQRSRIEMNYT
jgi:hypothetical protein